MRTTITALKLFLVLTALTGLAYPLAVLAGARLMPARAEGSLVYAGGEPAGSALVGQNFSRPEYFHPRPSAVGYDPMPSGGSNLSATSAALLAAAKERREKGAAAPDMLSASASGLDPHISPGAAKEQCARVAAARRAGESDIMSLVERFTEPRQAGFLGEPRVNVLLLNMELDRKFRK